MSALNLGPGGVVRSFQTAYATGNGRLEPSFARQVAVAAGEPAPLDERPRPLRAVKAESGGLPVLPFRDVVNGNVRFADLQGKVVLIGLTASGLVGPSLSDVSGQAVPGVLLQARAVSSLLGPPSSGCRSG